ncbi:MAG TPA: enoyl-ACP reductase [Limnochordia bacterium]
MIDMSGKTGAVFGIANKRSIAWAIARALDAAGVRLAVTYANERLEENVRELARELNNPLVLPCDVTQDGQIDAVFAEIERTFGRLDCLAHCIAFAPKEELDGRYVDTSREGFGIAHDISTYSLTALAKRARPLLAKAGGSIVTLTYYGAEKAVPNYNVMGVAKAALEASVRYLAADLGPEGIRVNAISAGPVNTLAARGVSGFTGMLKVHAERAPLKRNIQAEEVGSAALFLFSPLASAITGEVIYVDAGYHIMGM